MTSQIDANPIAGHKRAVADYGNTALHLTLIEVNVVHKCVSTLITSQN
jgi:hypothetical protein